MRANKGKLQDKDVEKVDSILKDVEQMGHEHEFDGQNNILKRIDEMVDKQFQFTV